MLNKPGSISIEKIERYIVKQNNTASIIDLKSFCLNIELYEDIFSNTMSGRAVFIDSGGQISLNPFTGNDYLQISIKTPLFSEKIEKAFYITRIYERAFQEDPSVQTYIIDFISRESQINKLLFISQKFSNTTDKIISEIFDNNLKISRNLDNSTVKTSLVLPQQPLMSDVSFVSPYWTPFKIINWLAARSFNTTDSRPDFLFFESNKRFYFSSIYDLIKSFKDSKTVFTNYLFGFPPNAIATPEEAKYKFKKPGLDRDYSIVKNISPFQTMDIFKSHDSGHLGSSISNVNITTKQSDFVGFNYLENYTKFPHIEGENYPLFSQFTSTSFNSYKSILFNTSKLHTETQNPLNEKWALQRNSLIHDLFGMKLEITVPGRTDIEVGYLINFLCPRGGPKTQSTTDLVDKYVSGLYVITAIKHIFSPEEHIMTLEIAKDSSSYKIG